MPRVAVVRFPGSNCDFDTLRAAESVGADAYFVWHRDADLRGRRCRGPARRVQLRRLPSLRRHRPVQPGHAGGAAPRRRRRTGARHLQRISDPLRGAPASRSPACGMRDSPSCPSRWMSPSSRPTPRSPATTSRRSGCGFRWPTARAGSWRRPIPCACSRPRAESCCAMWPQPSARRFSPTRTDPPITSPASATPTGTSSGSCLIPSAPPTACWA